MESKFTKGPWRLMKHVATGIESERGRFVATSGSYSDGTEKSDLENKANGKLIAAAPDLLKALQAAKTELEMYIPVTDVKVLDKIQAALNKALD